MKYAAADTSGSARIPRTARTVSLLPVTHSSSFDIMGGRKAAGIGADLHTDASGENLVCITVADPEAGALCVLLTTRQLDQFAHRLAALVEDINDAKDPFATLRSGTVQ